MQVFAQELAEGEVSYGLGDLTLIWAALITGNPQKKKIKFRQLAGVTVVLLEFTHGATR